MAPVDDLFHDLCPGFVSWAEQHFLATLRDPAGDIFFVQPLRQAKPTYSLQRSFGDMLELTGYDVGLTTSAPGTSRMYVTLYWRALRPIAEDYTIFIHVRDGSRRTFLNGDHRPYDGAVPTTRFPPGLIVKDTTWMDVPPGLPAGAHDIVCGLYSLETGARLQLADEHSGECAVQIGSLRVSDIAGQRHVTFVAIASLPCTVGGPGIARP